MISPNSEKACPKSEKASPPKQAYYGPGVPMPPSYLNSVVMACHVPHPHVWAPPQHVMPPYGVPLPSILLELFMLILQFLLLQLL
ncbi:hypothetical protein CsSME_00023469 [Camellia sinensis var. sinensis]